MLDALILCGLGVVSYDLGVASILEPIVCNLMVPF